MTNNAQCSVHQRCSGGHHEGQSSDVRGSLLSLSVIGLVVVVLEELIVANFKEDGVASLILKGSDGDKDAPVALLLVGSFLDTLGVGTLALSSKGLIAAGIDAVGSLGQLSEASFGGSVLLSGAISNSWLSLCLISLGSSVSLVLQVGLLRINALLVSLGTILFDSSWDLLALFGSLIPGVLWSLIVLWSSSGGIDLCLALIIFNESHLCLGISGGRIFLYSESWRALLGFDLVRASLTSDHGSWSNIHGSVGCVGELNGLLGSAACFSKWAH